jgi:hypothetical protein
MKSKHELYEEYLHLSRMIDRCKKDIREQESGGWGSSNLSLDQMKKVMDRLEIKLYLASIAYDTYQV